MRTSPGSTEKRKKILIRSTNWIGDVVMSLPAIREIKRLNPDHSITMIASRWVSEIYQDQNLADTVVSFEPEQSSLRLLRRIRQFDQAILLQNAFEAALLVFLARVPKRIGYAVQGRGFLLTDKARPRVKKLQCHQIYYYLDLLYQTGVSPVDYLAESSYQPDLTLKPSASGNRAADQLMERENLIAKHPLIGLNPGAFFGPAKRWMIDRYAQLADQLIQTFAARILIVGSLQEINIAEKINQKMKHQAIILSGKTTLASLIAILSRLNLFITNDSGPMHLGAALNIPMIALFGSTDEVATGPVSTRSQVIHKHVECSPCLRRECPIDLRCFNAISVEEVFEEAAMMLKQYPVSE